MNKTKYQKDLMDIQNISNTIRKMNEGVMFEDEYDELGSMEQEPQPMNEPEPQDVETGAEAQANIKDVKPEDQGMAELDKMGELDQIREITLKGMLKFSNQPEHPQFQALQKIFQLCNKAVEPKENTQGA